MLVARPTVFTGGRAPRTGSRRAHRLARHVASRLAHRLGLTRRELGLLCLAVGLGVAVRLAFVVATRGHVLAGDEIEYDIQGRFFADGMPWWSTTPYGDAHPSLWKAPGYTAWVGLWYAVLGTSPDRVFAVQAVLLAPVTVTLGFLLARRLFGAGAGVAAAFVLAVYPFAWQFEVRLFSESLAVPLTTGVLLILLDRPPTRRVVVATGLLLGAAVLVRPSSLFLFPGVLVAWIAATGWRRGLATTAAATGIAVLCVAPWTVRNAVVGDGFVPVSIQSAALYCTFNEVAARNEVFPYACQILTPGALEVLETPRSDVAFADALREQALDYIADNPLSVPQAFFWNGLSRLWDVRNPARALDEMPFEGRSEAVTAVGLALYLPLLALALWALWRHRARRALVLPVLAIALAASVVYTSASGTRYRAPLEPLIVALACSTPLIARAGARLAGEREAPR